MTKWSKIDYSKFSDIEIYELVLQGRMHCFPSGFWINNNIKDAKEIAINLLRYLLDEKLKYSREDILNTVSKKFLTKYKLHTASKLFSRSAIKYVMATYPGEFQPWQFKNDKVPEKYWTEEQNRIDAIRYLFEVELQWNIEDINIKLAWDIIKNKGFITLHSYYPNLYKLVNAAYPDKIKPWELMNSEVPDGTWDDKNNRIMAIKWLINKSKTCNRKIDRKAFAEYGLSELLGAYYRDNVKRALNEIPSKK